MSKQQCIPGGYRSITEFFSTGSFSSCLPRTGVSSQNAANAVVDDDEASRQCSNRLSPLPETETSGSCLRSSDDDQLEDDEMALDDNEMALEQPESESAGSVPGNAAHPPSRVQGFLDVGDLVKTSMTAEDFMQVVSSLTATAWPARYRNSSKVGFVAKISHSLHCLYKFFWPPLKILAIPLNSNISYSR